MKKKVSLVLFGLAMMGAALAFAGQAGTHAKTRPSQAQAGYVCPVTGESLPCPACCPLHK